LEIYLLNFLAVLSISSPSGWNVRQKVAITSLCSLSSVVTASLPQVQCTVTVNRKRKSCKELLGTFPYVLLCTLSFQNFLYIRINKKSSYKFEIRWTMHEPQSIVLKNHHLKVVFLHLLSIWNSCNVVRQNGREFPPPPTTPPPRPQGKCCGRVGGGGRLKLLREFKPERRHGSTRVPPGHAFLA
jgi:hypothetical protein